MTANAMYYELKQNYSITELAKKLYLHTGTLKRWKATRKIPNEYLFDLNFLLGNKYELTKANYRSHNEFFTKKEIAKYCFESFRSFAKLHKVSMKNYTFIEPSCGDCSFYDLMPKNKRVGIDLEYKNNEILC